MQATSVHGGIRVTVPPELLSHLALSRAMIGLPPISPSPSGEVAATYLETFLSHNREEILQAHSDRAIDYCLAPLHAGEITYDQALDRLDLLLRVAHLPDPEAESVLFDDIGNRFPTPPEDATKDEREYIEHQRERLVQARFAVLHYLARAYPQMLPSQAPEGPTAPML
jgi:hypothetical protein